MKFTKIKDVKSPIRSIETDAGIDFYIPEYSEEYAKILEDLNGFAISVFTDYEGNNCIAIGKQESVLLPLGVRVDVKEGTALVAENKSGVASQKGLLVGACVVDRFYEGEVILNLHNVGKHQTIIQFGQKAIQFVQYVIANDMPEEISNEEYEELTKQNNSKRGAGGFGHTGL